MDTNIKAHNFIPAEYWKSNFRSVKEALLLAEVYVYEYDTEIQGFIGLNDEYVEGIFVSGEMQSQGIGKILLNYAKDKRNKLHLNVYQKNARAISFYKREGFEIQHSGLDKATGEKEYVMTWTFMKNIDIHGMTNMELIRGGIAEWYWATDYIHGDLYEAEELFRQGHLVRSNRLYLIHYPDGMIYEPVHSADGQYLGTPVYDGSSVVLLVVSFTESVIRIMRFLHQQVEVQEVARLPLSAVKDCYNLMLHTSPLSLTRQPNDGTFEIIWPEHVRFAINDREALNFRDGDKLYFNVWYEDPDYREETVVRSLHDGTILERFPGDIRIMPNGVRWLIK